MVQLVNAEFVAGEATLNITWAGQQGDLPQPILFDASDADVLRWGTEAVQAGIPGITADAGVEFRDFVVDRYPAKQGLPNRVYIRPKTPFGVKRVA
jgi:hypothetical protein